MRRPIVIVPACVNQIGAHAYHTAQDKYLQAVVVGAQCMPLVLPALGEAADLAAVLATADGIMLTGSPSNLHPSHYGEDVYDASLPQDAARDATTLPLIRAALKLGIPLIAVCRGFQEVNVALGGSLHQAVQEVGGMQDHRESAGLSLDQQYGPAHRVALEAHGRMARILGGAAELMVNSLHGQGIARLAPGLVVEARADDGLVEAYSVAAAPGFTLAVQWHPEWRIADNPDSMKLFLAFGQACRNYQNKKQGGV
ncbi:MULTISPECIES: gamma-glutamyl-gamma-aminobutyrate hydrolase family protein [unclassified Janthinobacterium]|uniref:gamma-glutamyl-gamma-aminobutyrate hydrolase family protein n=1 Tax=unclassified Janthinobacterium TaxID=2610881 RepID=UPI000349662F|nr:MULTISPECIES: gamma-glutamyl-gamma-aminobutyrate hydrolase family protein [unclassified Janthinobacterium]MEC5161607.1 putative glutamine amidotransferase [Janthinobacterium sp. CG_S6]